MSISPVADLIPRTTRIFLKLTVKKFRKNSILGATLELIGFDTVIGPHAIDHILY